MTIPGPYDERTRRADLSQDKAFDHVGELSLFRPLQIWPSLLV